MRRKRSLFGLLGFAAVITVVAVGCGTQGPGQRAAAPVASRTVVQMTPGVYTQTVTGFYPGIQVEVTLSANRIENVRILSHSETAGIAQPAFDLIPAEIVRYQSTMVDVVAGATMTSMAIRHAVEQAVTAAGGNVVEYQVPTQPRVAFNPRQPSSVNRGSAQTPRRWHETYDIVVVGGGFAGLAAAHAAATNGASVILVEKMPFLGGNSIINGGVYAAYTSRIAADIQGRHGIPPDTAEQHIRDTMVGGDFMSYESLVRKFVHGSPFMLNMFLDNGLRVRDGITRTGGHYGFRTYTTYSGQGSCIVEVQVRMAEQAGVRIDLNTMMVRIFREDGLQSGRVVGIAVQTNEGIRNIRGTRAVILATGGFGANVPMRSRHVPELDNAIPTTNHVGATGEGITFAQEIGADTIQMSYIQLYPFAEPNHGILDLWAVIPFTGPGAGIVYVDVEGRRFVNEGGRRDDVARAMMTSGGFPTFAIFGNDIVHNGGFTNQADIDAGIAAGRVLRADTLEGLALEINRQTYRDPLNMNPATLAATINAHNGFVTNLHDPEFGKLIDPGLTRLIDPPFYAIAQWPSVHHTMGGLAVTDLLEVIDIWGSPIPNLYAAGEILGAIHGTNRLGSNAVADSVALGFMAGYYTVTGRLPAFAQR